MKKVFVILSIMALAACNGNGATETVDSTKVDSVVVDTVVVPETNLKLDSVELGGPQPGPLEIK